MNFGSPFSFSFRSVIGFACDCGEPSVKAGMSIQLLSVCLATLMALFRDSDLALQVTQEDLMLLVRETATALLDPRLVPGASELDEATSSQMVRAINKTTISAATGATRHTSLQALMTIQQQLTLEPSDDPESEAFHRRMSRVVTKLFARVIRAEEGVSTPYSPGDVDMESLICIMDDTLVACDQAEEENATILPDAIESCREMTKGLVESIVKAYDGPDGLYEQMDDLGIDSVTSKLGKLIASCTGPTHQDTSRSPDTLPPRPRSDANKGPSVSALVSSFVNAKESVERETALDALRRYKKEHGDSDLKAHLDQVSPAFRAFLEEQLSALKEESPEKASLEKSGSMSQRLRNLRSRLEGKDLHVQTEGTERNSSTHCASSPSPSLSLVSHFAEQVAPVPASTPTVQWMVADRPVPSPTTYSSSQPEASPRRSSGIPSPSMRSSRLTQPSPSRLPQPTTFRERLAASGTSHAPSPTAGGSPDASNRAAALRARLEAIRKN
jgi:hypothetical protein